jgi:hypothetical protein
VQVFDRRSGVLMGKQERGGCANGFLGARSIRVHEREGQGGSVETSSGPCPD